MNAHACSPVRTARAHNHAYTHGCSNASEIDCNAMCVRRARALGQLGTPPSAHNYSTAVKAEVTVDH